MATLDFLNCQPGTRKLGLSQPHLCVATVGPRHRSNGRRCMAQPSLQGSCVPPSSCQKELLSGESHPVRCCQQDTAVPQTLKNVGLKSANFHHHRIHAPSNTRCGWHQEHRSLLSTPQNNSTPPAAVEATAWTYSAACISRDRLLQLHSSARCYTHKYSQMTTCRSSCRRQGLQ
jgi:hypothetical protein